MVRNSVYAATLLLILSHSCHCLDKAASKKDLLEGKVSSRTLKGKDFTKTDGNGRTWPYKWVESNYNNYVFWNTRPYGYVNFTGSQADTVAALGNAAIFLGSLFVLGSLPAGSVVGKKIDHRLGSLHNPHPDFTMSQMRRRRPSLRSRRIKNRRKKKPLGMRRLKKKSGQAVRQFTYRKRPRPATRHHHPNHKQQGLPLPPMSDVVAHKYRNKFNKVQPINIREPQHPVDYVDYQYDQILDPVRTAYPTQTSEVPLIDYYDDYPNAIPDFLPPTPLIPEEPQIPKRTRKPLLPQTLAPSISPFSDYDNSRGPIFEESPLPPQNNRVRSRPGFKRRYPMALGSTGTATTTASPNTLGTLNKDLTSTTEAEEKPNPIRGSYFNPTMNLMGGPSVDEEEKVEEEEKKNNVNKQYELNNSIRVKRKRVPLKRKRIPNKRVNAAKEPSSTDDPISVLERIRGTKNDISAGMNYNPSIEEEETPEPPKPPKPFEGFAKFPGFFGSQKEKSGIKTRNPFKRRPSEDSSESRGPGSDSGFGESVVRAPEFFKTDGYDPFAEMKSGFDGDNKEEWITTISKAFEGFSDFKKINSKENR